MIRLELRSADVVIIIDALAESVTARRNLAKSLTPDSAIYNKTCLAACERDDLRTKLRRFCPDFSTMRRPRRIRPLTTAEVSEYRKERQ